MNNIYFPIQHLDKPAINTPGLCDFYFAKVEDVVYWPEIDPLTGTYTSGILLRPGATWYRCETLDAERDYKVVSKTSSAGNYTEVTLEGFLPDDSPVNALTVTAMVYHQFVVVVRERNKMMRLLGSSDAGVVFSHSYESQDKAGLRGSKIVFSWRSPLPPIIYLTAVSATGEVINPPWEGGGGGAEVDPTVPAFVKKITQSQIDSWSTAYGWGNHAAAGYLKKTDADTYYAAKGHTHTWGQITGKPDDIEFVVGHPGSPDAGTTVYTNPGIAGRTIRLFRYGSKKTASGMALGDGYTQPDGSGTITVMPEWGDGEIISIEIIK